MNTPWSILYSVADSSGEIFNAGPFDTEELAMKWAFENEEHNVEDAVKSEFNILKTCVYILGPDHTLTELTAADFGVFGLDEDEDDSEIDE